MPCAVTAASPGTGKQLLESISYENSVSYLRQLPVRMRVRDLRRTLDDDIAVGGVKCDAGHMAERLQHRAVLHRPFARVACVLVVVRFVNATQEMLRLSRHSDWKDA